MTILEQYLRILPKSFGDDDFQRYALNFGYYLADNVGGVTIRTNLVTHT